MPGYTEERRLLTEMDVRCRSHVAQRRPRPLAQEPSCSPIAALVSGGGNDTHQLTRRLDGGAAQALQELG